MESFEDKILENSLSLFEGSSRILLAVSGGVDSVAMAHVLARLKQKGSLTWDFVIGHVNHCLRGADSDADEVFVRELADCLAIPVVTKATDVKTYAQAHKLSIETAGRVVRLKTLAMMAEEYGCDCIATAHHKDDLAETMVHRFMRGTGFRGLCGIWPVSEVYGAEFIRPMLDLRRDDIIQYCNENQVQWRQDASNRDIQYTRNRIRHRLLPILLANDETIVEKLAILSRSCRRFQLFTDKLSQAIFDKGDFDSAAGLFSIKQDPLKDSAVWVFYEVVHKVLVKLGVGLRRYNRAHFESIRELIGKKRTSLALPSGVVARAMEDRLLFMTAAACDDVSVRKVPLRLEIGQNHEFGPWQICSRLLDRADVDVDAFIASKDANVEWFDADRVTGDIHVRCRQDGDRFHPIGAKRDKKIARFLIDAQLNAQAKKQAIVIQDDEKILWLAPIRMSGQAKITNDTSRILEIRFQRTDKGLKRGYLESQ